MSEYTLTRIKDLPQTADELLADDFFVVDGATGGVRKIAKDTVAAELGGGGGADVLAVQPFMRRDNLPPAAAEESTPAAATDFLVVQVFS